MVRREISRVDGRRQLYNARRRDLDICDDAWMQGATPGLRYYKAAYQESGPTNTKNAFTTYLATPLGISNFPREIAIPPMDWMQAIANVQFYREHETGGHFPAVECPDALVGDLREWFGGDIVKRALGLRDSKS